MGTLVKILQTSRIYRPKNHNMPEFTHAVSMKKTPRTVTIRSKDTEELLQKCVNVMDWFYAFKEISELLIYSKLL